MSCKERNQELYKAIANHEAKKHDYRIVEAHYTGSIDDIWLMIPNKDAIISLAKIADMTYIVQYIEPNLNVSLNKS